jgi:ubiquinone/menaquinone biosynthesis C-methylase UbiE
MRELHGGRRSRGESNLVAVGESLPPDALRAGYDRSAAGYDARFAELQRVKYDAVLARIAVPAGARVLDLGCGTGLLAARLAPAKVVGLDLTLGMLALAKPRLVPVQGDALALPFRDGSFDLAFAITSLLVGARALPRALIEARRVLVPRGLFLVTLLRGDVPVNFPRELAACGFACEEPFECGQDVGFVAKRA